MIVFEFTDHNQETVEVELDFELVEDESPKPDPLEALITQHHSQALNSPYSSIPLQLTTQCWINLCYKPDVGILNTSITTSRKLIAPSPLRNQILSVMGYSPEDYKASIDDSNHEYQVARYVLPALNQLSFL